MKHINLLQCNLLWSKISFTIKLTSFQTSYNYLVLFMAVSFSVPFLSAESAGMFYALASLGSSGTRLQGGWCSSTTENVGSNEGGLRSDIVSQSSVLIGRPGHPFYQALSS